ncbi:SMP-30/gluconolactonase/LRE family protein [Hymenobacter wooponensis]|nr:SMP-30/gluconolactonase/LRE family protein [Hymenobacter wooponensis]
MTTLPTTAQIGTEPANAGRMSTLAGMPPNGSPGSTDGPALQARFNWPRGLALGADGTLYVADTKNETIRAISPAGLVRTLAGQAGRPGFAQGSGPQARFNQPVGVVVDATGTLYVVDQGNQAVRKITPDGTVSTVVGHPTSPASSIQSSASLQLVKPTAIAWGPGGDLYVSDENQGSIYRINPATGAVRTWLSREQYLAVASQAPRFRGMELVSLVFDPTGTGYVGDGQGVIRKISPQGELRDWVGTAGVGGFEDGTGPDGQLGNPTGLALGPDGTLYVADERFAVIRRVSPAGRVSTLAGQGDQTGSRNGPVATARFLLPRGLARAADGTLFVADELGSCIRRISPQGQVSTWAGAPVRLGGDDGPGATAQFQAPEAVAVDAGGTVYVAEGGGMAVRKIAPDGEVSTLYGGQERPSAPARSVYLHHPTGVAVAPSGIVYVSEAGSNVIYQISPQGSISLLAGRPGSDGDAVDGKAAEARFSHPSHLAVGPGGTLYVLDEYNALVRTISPQGQVSTLVGKLPTYMGPRDPLLGTPTGLAVDAAGTVYVSDGPGHVIRRITPAGMVSVWAGQPGQAGHADGTGHSARFQQPAGLSLDRQGNLYVADLLNSTVRRVSPAGVVTTLVGEAGQPGSTDGRGAAGRLSQPRSVAIGPDGAVYIADSGNATIRVVR